MRHFSYSPPPPFLCVFDGSRRVIILPLLFFLLGQRDGEEKERGRGDRGLEKRAKRVKKEREEWGKGDPWVLLGEEGDVLQEGGVKNSCSFLENFFGVTIALQKKPNRLKVELENCLGGRFCPTIRPAGLFFSFLLFFFNSFCGNSAPFLLRPSSSSSCDNLNSNYCSTPVPFPSLFLLLFLALVVVETVVKREGKGSSSFSWLFLSPPNHAYQFPPVYLKQH